MDELFRIVERGKKEWESAVDSISEGVALFEIGSLTVRRANWTLARWLFTTPHEMAGANLAELLCECNQADVDLAALLSSSTPASLEITRPSTAQKWVLSVFPIQRTNQPLTNSVLVIRDVTQERLLQQGIIDAEKRAAMVRTVAGLAQQVIPSVGYIQQQLSIINAHMEEMRNAFVDYRIALRASENAQAAGRMVAAACQTTWESIESRHRVEFMLGDIDQAVRQASQDLMRIYKSIDDLSNLQGATPKMQYNDLNLILENTVSYVWPDLSNKVSIERRYQKNLPLVRCNQLRLQTALMSLLVCCTQNIPDEGQVILETQRLNGHVQVQIEGIGRREMDTAPGGTELDAKAGLIKSIIAEHQGELKMDMDAREIVSALVTLPINGPNGAL